LPTFSGNEISRVFCCWPVTTYFAVSKGCDKIVEGDQVGIPKRLSLLLWIGGQFFTDKTFCFVQIAAETFVAGEVIAENGEAGIRLGGILPEELCGLD